MTLEEKEHLLKLSQERQAILPGATTNRYEIPDDEAVVTSDVPMVKSNVSMVAAVRYRKEMVDNCHGDGRVDEASSQDDHSVSEAIEMVAITADSSKTILLPSELQYQKKVIFIQPLCMLIILGNLCPLIIKTNNFILRS